MNAINVEKFVNQILSETLEVSSSDITPEVDLLDDLGADSLMILEVMARIDTQFKIEIDQSRIAEMISPKAICDVVLSSTPVSV